MKEHTITKTVRTDGRYCHSDCDGLVYAEETECHFFGGCLYSEFDMKVGYRYPRNQTCKARFD